MRLNRGTIVLLAASVVVIVAVLLLNNQQASAPGPTPAPTLEGEGPIFPDIADETARDALVRFEAANNDTGELTVMTKDDGGAWSIDEATNASFLATDQEKAVNTVGILASMTSNDRFVTDRPADFGLDAPRQVFVLSDKDGQTYTLKVGNSSPTAPRYYAQVNDDISTVYVLPRDPVDTLARQMITLPPYVASPTPTPTATRTPNPYSEVDQTATAAVQQTLAAEILTATAEATPEATAEAPAEATPEAPLPSTATPAS